MKILVCISHVPDTTSKINFSDDKTKFDPNGVQFVINPNDEFGLTRAMWFKEKQGAQVIVANVGGAETEPTLRKALAIGADEAIRVNTPATDGFSVAKQLANVISNGGYDLVIAGRESIDFFISLECPLVHKDFLKCSCRSSILNPNFLILIEKIKFQ